MDELACDCRLVSGSGLLVLQSARNPMDCGDLHMWIIKTATANHNEYR